MEQLRKQMLDLSIQLRFVSDELAKLQLQQEEEVKSSQQKTKQFVPPQTESWDDDDEPPFSLTSGYTGLAVRRIIRRSASKCPACGKIGGCSH